MSCLAVEVEVQSEEFTLDTVAFGLCFFFGMLIGAAVFIGIGWLCIRDVKSRQDPDSEKGEREEDDSDRVELVTASKSRPTTAMSTKSGKKKRLQSAKKKKGGEDEPLVPIAAVTLVDVNTEAPPAQSTKKESTDKQHSNYGGMVDALLQPNAAAMEMEIVGQDVEAVNSLERELKEESIMTMIQLMRTLLGQQMNKGKLTEVQYKDMMKEAQDNIGDIIGSVQTEREHEEEELKKKIKDPVKRQAEIDNLHGKYMTKMNTLLTEEKEKMRSVLSKKSDLTEEEIEALLAQYTNQMALLESKLGTERARQAAGLEERLARRRYMAEMHTHEKTQQKEELEHRKDTNEQMLNSLVSDGKMTDKQKEELLKQYDTDVMRLQVQHEKEFNSQKETLAEKLRRAREEKTKRLTDEQEKQREGFVKDTGSAKPKEVVEQYHRLLAEQRGQRDQLSDDLDDKENQQFNALLKEHDDRKGDELEKKEVEFQKKLKTQGSVSDADLRRLLDVHEQEMQEYERVKKNEKKKMKSKLEQKLAERKMKADEQLALNEAEQKTVKAQQDDTIKKVLESQKELSKDARDEIMQEHERNMTAIQNQLQMSKLRQQKILDQKMAARRMKVEELKEKQDDIKRNKRQYSEAQRNKLQAQLEKQIAEEEARLDKERKDLLNDLRRRMAKETEEALNEQDKQMGALIARLQVGQARRQAIITKQDKTLKELENKLAAQVDDRNTASPNDNAQVDYLLKQHHRDVGELNNQIDDAKQRQEIQLRDKLEAKKLAKEREVEHKLETEAHTQWEEQRMRGAKISSNILGQVMLEQRHKMEIKRIEKEMGLEMQKQREQLNNELEQELQGELEERKRTFLAQIAAIKGMSKSELNQLVDSAVIDAGGDEREAKKLRKDFNSDVQRAKSELGVEDRQNTAAMRRSKPNYGEDNYYEDKPRPKSGKKRRQVNEVLKDEDDF